MNGDRGPRGCAFETVFERASEKGWLRRWRRRQGKRETEREELAERVYLWICDNRWVDDEVIAERFGISLGQAGDIVDALLRAGRLEESA